MRQLRRLQTAVEGRRVSKLYLAILCGDLREATVVDAPLALSAPVGGADLAYDEITRRAEALR